MVVKILLFLSIVFSALTLVVSELKLKDKISSITSENTKTKEDLDGMTKQKEKFAKDAREKTDENDKLSNDLKTSQDAAKAAMEANAEEQKKTAKLDTDLKKAAQDIVDAKATAKKFFDLNKTPEDIQKTYNELPKAQDGYSTAVQEMKILAVQYTKVKSELDSIKYKDTPVVLPEGLKGKVVVVDPKWEFVVINIGAAQGVKHGGELYINREGKLIGKVRVVTVEANHCIGNIIQQWKKGEVLEGDEVKFAP